MTTTTTSPLLAVGLPTGATALPTGATALLAAAGGSRTLDLVDRLESYLSPDPTLVLVHDDRPAWSEPGAPGHELALVRTALRRDDVVLRLVTGPVSRTVLLARLLGDTVASAAALAAMVDPLLGSIRTYALLGSVAHLDKPAPTVAQHARGLVPGACFLVDGESVTATKGRLPRGLGRGAEAVLATSEGSDVDSDWPDRLWAALGPSTGMPEPLVVAGGSVWGTSRWAEISVSATTPAAVVARLDGVALTPCPWCRRPVLDEAPCPFCGADSRRHDTHRPPEEPS